MTSWSKKFVKSPEVCLMSLFERALDKIFKQDKKYLLRGGVFREGVIVSNFPSSVLAFVGVFLTRSELTKVSAD